MTRVWLDREAGYCGGVRRAVRGAKAARARLEAARRVLSYGELVHNPRVLADLRASGIAQTDDLAALQGDELVVIRTHGIAPSERAALAARNVAWLDLTCPRVARAQQLAAQAGRSGAAVLVVGDARHPEVRGILGHAGDGAGVLSGRADAEAYSGPQRVVLLAQTTISAALFDEVTAALLGRGFEVTRIDTLCPYVARRQAWIDRFARLAGASLVLGGRGSSNTARLYDTALRHGPAWWIAAPDEVDLDAVLRHGTLAVTAGASTPPEDVAELAGRLRAAGAHIQRR